MKQQENDVERYLGELEQLLPGDREQKTRFLERMEENILQYEEEANVEADYDRLVTYFGSPSTIAKDYAAAWEGELTKADAITSSHISWESIAFWICAALLLTCTVLLLCHFSIGFLRAVIPYMVATNA